MLDLGRAPSLAKLEAELIPFGSLHPGLAFAGRASFL
jgi:hypothetical protein